MPRSAVSEYDKQTDVYRMAIKVAMTSRKVNQKKLAERLNKSQAMVSRYLKEPDCISLGELRAIASYLGLQITIGEKNK